MSVLPHIIHITVTTRIQPLSQFWPRLTQIGVRNSDISKIERTSLLSQPVNLFNPIDLSNLLSGHDDLSSIARL